jgi:hypothetical protein
MRRVSAAIRESKRGRTGEDQVHPRRGENPEREETSGELRALCGLNRRIGVTDFRAEQSLEVEVLCGSSLEGDFGCLLH